MKKSFKTVISMLICAFFCSSLILGCGKAAGQESRNGAAETTAPEAVTETAPEIPDRIPHDNRLMLDGPFRPDPAISNLPLGIYLFAEGFDPDTEVLTCIVSNQSGYEMEYGDEYWLEVMKNGEFVKLEPVKEYGWNDIAHVIKDLEEQTVSYDLSVYGPLTSGDYRLVKNDGMAAEFRLVYPE